MKNVERVVLGVFALISLFAAHQLVDRLFQVHEWKGLDASSWAAWVQAIGSIAALAIAIFIMARQNEHAAQLVADADRIATLRRARSVHAVLKRSLNQLSGVFRLAKTAVPDEPDARAHLDMSLGNAIEIVETLEKRIGEIPVYDLGAFKMSDGVMQISEVLDSIRTALSGVKNVPGAAGSAEVVKAINYFDKIQQEGMQKFEAGMKELET